MLYVRKAVIGHGHIHQGQRPRPAAYIATGGGAMLGEMPLSIGEMVRLLS